MSLDAAFLYAFLVVFVRCSAMLMVSPMFGAQSTPLPIRIFTTLSISGALTLALKPSVGPVPSGLYELATAVLHEAIIGVLLGSLAALIMQAAQMGGAFLDLQIGLGSSQIMNPVEGVPVSVVSQFKNMLCLVLFLGIDGHHVMLNAFAASFQSAPGGADWMLIQQNVVSLVGEMSLIALQIAAPVAAVSFVVDAALGIVNKAVPQMQVFMVGMPAKLAMGFLTLSLALPPLTGVIRSGVETAFTQVAPLLR
ncbi:MAG TPA: flagellar biosynthetic protein FliR [Fimbriimonadaceae bacterium]|nr:flagellar biosynthetic protein FliR [Fimbriimonadaceae bacterium]